MFPNLLVLDNGLDGPLHHGADEHGLPSVKVSAQVLIRDNPVANVLHTSASL